MDTWFDDPVLGRLPPYEAATELLEESEHVPSFEESKGLDQSGWWPFQDSRFVERRSPA